MKTKKEVKKYIESQEWYNEFKEELMKNRKITVEKYFSDIGRMTRQLILGAFTWSQTLQGQEYWKNIEKAYLDWYDSKR